MEDKRLLTAEEVAGRFAVSVQTVRRLVKSGELPGRKIGRQWRFDPVELDRKGAGWKEPAEEALNQIAPEELIAFSPEQRGEIVRERILEALALAEELDPVIEEGTLGPVDATEDIHALREERMRQIAGE